LIVGLNFPKKALQGVDENCRKAVGRFESAFFGLLRRDDAAYRMSAGQDNAAVIHLDPRG
jgi:hypothetical protein